MAPLPAGRALASAAGRARLVLEVAGAVAVCFDAPTVELFEQRAEALHPNLRKLGPDLLVDPFDLDEALRRLRDSQRPPSSIAEALLDQRALAGDRAMSATRRCGEARVSPFVAVEAVDDALRTLVERSGLRS